MQNYLHSFCLIPYLLLATWDWLQLKTGPWLDWARILRVQKILDGLLDNYLVYPTPMIARWRLGRKFFPEQIGRNTECYICCSFFGLNSPKIHFNSHKITHSPRLLKSLCNFFFFFFLYSSPCLCQFWFHGNTTYVSHKATLHILNK